MAEQSASCFSGAPVRLRPYGSPIGVFTMTDLAVHDPDLRVHDAPI
jgi:hypothetical protein